MPIHAPNMPILPLPSIEPTWYPPTPATRLTTNQLDQADAMLNEIRGQITRLSAGLHAQHARTVAEALAACREDLARIEALASAIGAKP